MNWIAVYLEPLLLVVLLGAIWWAVMAWIEKIDRTP